MKPYRRPPDDYEPPTQCEKCGELMIYGPVIGGYIWHHLIPTDHDAVMRPAGWWDVATGEIRYSTGLPEVLAR